MQQALDNIPQEELNSRTQIFFISDFIGYNNARSVARKNMFGEKRGGANGARGRGRGNGRGNGRGGDRGNGRGNGRGRGQ